MPDKNFGVKQINIISGSGTPTITSPNNLNLNASIVAISTDVTIGGRVQSNVIIGTGYSVGIGITNPTSPLTVSGNTSLQNLTVSGVSTFSGISNFTQGITVNNQGINLSSDVPIYFGNAAQGYISYGSGLFQIRGPGGTTPLILGAGPTAGANVRITSGDGNSNYAVFSGTGVTVTGTTFTNQLSVSGDSTLGIVTGATYYGDASNAVDGRWTLGANGTSDYTFTGIGFTQTTNDPVLYLARGRVYEFVNNSGGSHPFQIRLSNGGTAYDDGVTNNGSASGTILFKVPFSAPNTLYYQCTNHSGMGNTISIYPNTI